MEFYCNDQKKQDVFIASCFLYDITDDILLFLYRLVERLSEVGYYVVHVFYADGKAYQVGGYACFLELFIGQLAVRMACRMQYTGACVCHVGYYVYHLKRVHEPYCSVAVALQSQ